MKRVEVFALALLGVLIWNAVALHEPLLAAGAGGAFGVAVAGLLFRTVEAHWWPTHSWRWHV